MIIIEFCGNPGTGKTTIAAQLTGKLKEEGYTAYDYNEIKPQKYIGNLRYLLSPKSLMLAVSLFRFGRCSRFGRRIVYSTKIASVRQQFLQWKKQKGADFVIFDEGIIQYLSTLSHGSKAGKTELDKVPALKQIYQDPSYFVINCELDYDENIRRIRNRSREGDRFVYNNNQAQLDALTLKRENLNIILDQMAPKNRLDIQSNQETGSAVQIIMNHIL